MLCLFCYWNVWFLTKNLDIWPSFNVVSFTTGSLTQAIRNFAKSLENWLKSAMHFVPEEMVKTKVNSIFDFKSYLAVKIMLLTAII